MINAISWIEHNCTIKNLILIETNCKYVHFKDGYGVERIISGGRRKPKFFSIKHRVFVTTVTQRWLYNKKAQWQIGSIYDLRIV